MSPAIIEIQNVGFSPLTNHALRGIDEIPVGELRRSHGHTIQGGHHQFAVDYLGADLDIGPVLDFDGGKIGYVQVQGAVPIDVRQGQRGAAKLSDQTAVDSFAEAPFAVVEKQARAATQPVHQQVQV